MLIAGIIASLSFAACGDDDDDDNCKSSCEECFSGEDLRTCKELCGGPCDGEMNDCIACAKKNINDYCGAITLEDEVIDILSRKCAQQSIDYGECVMEEYEFEGDYE